VHVLTALWLGITTESKKTDIIIINQLIKRIAHFNWQSDNFTIYL
jgi:hypothetical protein